MKQISNTEDYTTSLINHIIKYIDEMHQKHADGCEWSCNECQIGYNSSTYGVSYYYCRFGGHCFGDLSENEEVRAESLLLLYVSVRAIIEDAVKDNL